MGPPLRRPCQNNWPRFRGEGHDGTQQGPYSLGYRIRKNGVIDKDLRQKAEDAAQAYYEALHNGEPLPHEVEQEEEPSDEEEPEGPITLRRGFDKVLDPEEGLYQASAEADSHTRNRKRQAEYICALLGAERTFDKMVPSVVKSLWTQMAKRHTETGRFGPRTAEQTVGFLYRAQKWLVNNGHLSANEASDRMEGWRPRLKKDWEKITGEDPSPSRPAHTEAEMELIMYAVEGKDEDGNWFHPDLDPRFRLLMRLGAGQRLGMVARARRRQLHLDDSGGHGHGRLVIPTRDRKTGVTIDLTPDQRQHVEREMESGYLRRLEPAYQQGELDSYRLFPAGRLRDGAARLEQAQDAVGKSWRSDHFKALEEWVFHEFEDLSLWSEEQREQQTMHIDGRNAHGLRRRVARMSRQKGIDREARNAAWGWNRGSTVPDRLYDETDEELRQAGADAREEVLGALERDGQSEHGSETTDSDEPADQLLAALVDEYGSIEAALEALRARQEDSS